MSTPLRPPYFPFNPGQCTITPGAEQALGRSNQAPQAYLTRHVYGDWGDLDEHDQGVNMKSLPHRGRLMSVYKTFEGDTIWVITDPGWHTTTILLPSEY